jgi:hypothetical protein
MNTAVSMLYINVKGIIVTNTIYTSVSYLDKEGKNE